ncbi:tetratricopeptide repeat protein [Alteromonas aestuariivivens]|uniref:Tetratricopeptide repeat protein n=1 Tax=Alteromonas aestuariivivens TaxID=1938339 RepID=A0A3D8M3D2_9ALTE|nr:tetratricopeptide repeat protein [Alteromonas aestuariivivens]RDV24065.1 tetratricopeptide repeat protein [Alteromonas aestuariivivens]
MGYRILFVCCLLIGLLGCSKSTPDIKTTEIPTLKDSLFPDYTLFSLESEQEIFGLEDKAQNFVREAVWPFANDESSIRGLLRQIFDHSEMGLLYRSEANTTANETFLNQSANCLSLSIMTYAMAESAGFKAQFYEVQIPEYWTRREGYSLLNGHINLRLRLADEIGTTRLYDEFVDVDFDPQVIRNHFPRIPISKNLVVAMYYTNKGADALIANSYSQAYAYFRRAAVMEPEFASVWVNLGVLYRIKGDFEASEASYHQALAINDENLTAWENLAILYQHMQQPERAEEILASVERKRQDNPFYHFILGEQAFDEGLYDEALAHYRKAMRIDKNRHEVLFGMGKTFYELGDISKAKDYLEMAARKAISEQDEQRYLSKLSVLQSKNMM